MATILFYNFIFIASTLLVFISDKAISNHVKNIFIFLAIVVIAIPSAIRHDVGTDYQAYIYIFNNIRSYEWMELGFYYINYCLNLVDANEQWGVAIYSIIFSLIVAFALPKNNKVLLYSTFVLVVYLYSFNGVRQAITIALGVWACRQLIEYDKNNFNRVLVFLVIMLIAALFHRSALIIIFVFMLSLIPMPRGVKYYIAPALFLIVLCVATVKSDIFFLIIKKFMMLVGFDKYAGYFSSNEHFVTRNLGVIAIIGILAKQLMSLYLIFSTKRLVEQNKHYWFIVICSFFYSISYVFSAQIAIFGRSVALFSFVPVLAPYIIWNIKSRKALDKITVLLSIIILLLFFEKQTLGIVTEYNDPKLNPYKTIFNEG